MRYRLSSLNPEGNLLIDSRIKGEEYGVLFLLVKVGLYLEDEELLTRLVWEKCLNILPSLIEGIMSCLETEASSVS